MKEGVLDCCTLRFCFILVYYSWNTLLGLSLFSFSSLCDEWRMTILSIMSSSLYSSHCLFQPPQPLASKFAPPRGSLHTPHRLSPHGLSPHGLSPHSLSPRSSGAVGGANQLTVPDPFTRKVSRHPKKQFTQSSSRFQPQKPPPDYKPLPLLKGTLSIDGTLYMGHWCSNYGIVRGKFLIQLMCTLFPIMIQCQISWRNYANSLHL